MTEQNSTIVNILTELSKAVLNADQVAAILSNPKEFPAEQIDKLSLATALQYWNGQMDYDSGDCVMNNLFFWWSSSALGYNKCEFPGIAMECFNAFDSGEYYRQNDDKSIKPSEKYTRPLIEILLRQHNLIP